MPTAVMVVKFYGGITSHLLLGFKAHSMRLKQYLTLLMKQRTCCFVEIVSCGITIQRADIGGDASRQEKRIGSRDVGERDHVFSLRS